jgi:hypothetical protein
VKKRLDKPENPDIELTANVKARELRFDEVPDTEVHPPAQTKRKNLPEKVQPVHAGITFRDVSVDVRIADELTASEPDQWKKSRKEETKGFMRDHDSGKPSHPTGMK